MPRYTSSELTELFQHLQQFISDNDLSLDSASSERACIQVVQSFFQNESSNLQATSSAAADANNIIELLQQEDPDLQETGLSLLHSSEDEEIWRQITDGFAYAEGSWWDCFSHQMYRVTLGMLRAWSENPFSDHSHIKTLTLRADITDKCESISFVQHFPSIETLNVYKMRSLKTLEGLENASMLVEIDARETGLTDLRGLQNNPSLKTIILRDSQVGTLNGIQTTHRELSLDARGAPLTDVSAIPQDADAYLCVDELPTIGSPQVTYLRFTTEWLIDIRQFPNVHTVYVEKALYCAKGLLELPNLQHVFVKGHWLSDLFGGAMLNDIRSLNLNLSSTSWKKKSILFGDNFWEIPTE